jgi:hypothetical protein
MSPLMQLIPMPPMLQLLRTSPPLQLLRTPPLAQLLPFAPGHGGATLPPRWRLPLKRDKIITDKHLYCGRLRLWVNIELH